MVVELDVASTPSRRFEDVHEETGRHLPEQAVRPALSAVALVPAGRW